MKFIIFTEFGEILDLALYLKNVEKHEVLMFVQDRDYKKIGDGMVDKVDDWFDCLGKGYIWVFDGCSNGKLQDWLRGKGEMVFGGSEEGDKLENDRQLGQKLFKLAGFDQSESKNFKSIDEALAFVNKNKDKKFILKQNGDAPKSLNHMGKFDNNEDMIFHLEELKKKWNEAEMGKVDFDLMEIVEGLEVAASAFFNGTEYMKNKDGKIVGFLNFEEKREADGGLGETCGEMGTTFIGVDESNQLFKDIILRPKVAEALKASKFRGIIDINSIKTDKGITALEFTTRLGIPATSYEFLMGLDKVGETIFLTASGKTSPISVKQGIGMVMVVVAKPFPIDSNVEEESTSLGEKLWILDKGKPIGDFTDNQKKRIHLQNFYKDNNDYKVATKNGYLLTVVGDGKTIEETRDNLIEYIKDNIYISGQKYRTDIGKRVEKAGGSSKEQKLEKEYQSKVEDLKKQHQEELGKIKKSIKDAIYE